MVFILVWHNASNTTWIGNSPFYYMVAQACRRLCKTSKGALPDCSLACSTPRKVVIPKWQHFEVAPLDAYPTGQTPLPCRETLQNSYTLPTWAGPSQDKGLVWFWKLESAVLSHLGQHAPDQGELASSSDFQVWYCLAVAWLSVLILPGSSFHCGGDLFVAWGMYLLR